MRDLVSLIRPRHWVKNLFVFAPVFFAMKLTDPAALVHAAAAFAAFCLMASAVYCVNDILDAEVDRLHPVKRNRPVAAARLSASQAARIALVLAGAALLVVWPLGWRARIGLKVYLLINLLYSWKWKHVAVLDITLIAVGFLLRLQVGSAATGIPLSAWIVLLTFVLALFLAFSKRRDDVLQVESGAAPPRKSVDGFNRVFVEHGMSVMGAVAIVAYMLYTLSPDVVHRFHDRPVYLSAIFVIVGLLRYLQRALVENETGSPTEILWTDRFLQGCILGWLAALWVLLYR